MFDEAWKLHQGGRFSQAEQLYRQIIQADPSLADGWFFLGRVCQAQGKLPDAEASFRRAVQLLPEHPGATNCLGIVLAQQGKLAEAEACLEQAVQVQPDHVDALHNLGSVLSMEGKYDVAIDRYRQVLRLKPDHADAHYNLALALERTNRLQDAIGSYQQAVALQPSHLYAQNNLGNLLKQQGQLDEALASFDQALEAHPGHSGTRYNKAMLWLLRGEWERAWPDYEMRSTDAGFCLLAFPQPRWDGSPLNGRTILLYAEQSLGDTIQFIRYAALVKQRGGQVLVACQAPLLPLLASAPGIDRLLIQGSKLPPFDVQAPLLSLPGIMHTTPATVPATIPYLHANPELVEHWRRELKKGRGARDEGRESSITLSSLAPRPSPLAPFLVGIAWQGKPSYHFDRQRSIPLTQFAPLAEVPGVRLISLQKGPGAGQLQAPARQFPVLDLGGRLDESTGAFMDTAAVMKNLDLVICSDTAIPHLAGALGIPVWVALPLVPDWRWLQDRADTPWYPTMRLFRQTQHGHWKDVFARMAEELKRLLEPRTQ